jgi:hypothetical protein
VESCFTPPAASGFQPDAARESFVPVALFSLSRAPSIFGDRTSRCQGTTFIHLVQARLLPEANEYLL